MRSGRTQAIRLDSGSIIATARPAGVGADPLSTDAARSFARRGKPAANASRFSPTLWSFALVASSSRHPVDRAGCQPRRRAAVHAARSYQPSERSIAPRSRISVLISMTRSSPVSGWIARTSIHPRDRSPPISTSLAVSQPLRRSLDTTWAEHLAWAGSSCLVRSPRKGASTVVTRRAPMAPRRRSAVSIVRSVSRPCSNREISDCDKPARRPSHAGSNRATPGGSGRSSRRFRDLGDQVTSLK
jgi:hypothetical protein